MLQYLHGTIKVYVIRVRVYLHLEALQECVTPPYHLSGRICREMIVDMVRFAKLKYNTIVS